MMISIVNIPISRFRRELNTWMLFLKQHPENPVYITRKNKVVLVAISPLKYEELASVMGN